METLRYEIGRTTYEVNPAAIDKIEVRDASAGRRHGYPHGYRITFKGGGHLRVNNNDAVASIGIWLNRSGFPLTTPPVPEPEIEPEPESEPVPDPAPESEHIPEPASDPESVAVSVSVAEPEDHGEAEAELVNG